jgi:hypothetical protein
MWLNKPSTPKTHHWSLKCKSVLHWFRKRVHNTARLTFWDPDADIAGLELDEDEAFIDQVSPLVVIDLGLLWGHRFRAFGFPQRIDQGEWVIGKMTGVNAEGWIQIEGDGRPVHFVEVGFSGGPGWDEALNGIVGMIVGVEKGQDIRVAFFIPSAILAVSWPIPAPL